MVAKRDHEGSGSAHRTFTRVKEYVMFGILMCTLAGAAIMSWVSMRDRLISVEGALDRAQKVDRYLILNAEHTNRLIAHIVPASRRNELPAPPKGLDDAKLELLP